MPGGEFFYSPLEDSAERRDRVLRVPAELPGARVRGHPARVPGRRASSTPRRRRTRRCSTRCSTATRARAGSASSGSAATPGSREPMKHVLFDEKIDGSDPPRARSELREGRRQEHELDPLGHRQGPPRRRTHRARRRARPRERRLADLADRSRHVRGASGGRGGAAARRGAARARARAPWAVWDDPRRRLEPLRARRRALGVGLRRALGGVPRAGPRPCPGSRTRCPCSASAIDKERYLTALAAAGVPVVPTTFVHPGEPFDRAGRAVRRQAGDLGGRPALGAVRARRRRRAELSSPRSTRAGETAMVQPLLSGVAGERRSSTSTARTPTR